MLKLTSISAAIEVIIAVGGEDDKVVLRSVESFDPQTNHWRTLACLPFAVSKHGLVVTGKQLCYDKLQTVRINNQPMKEFPTKVISF